MITQISNTWSQLSLRLGPFLARRSVRVVFLLLALLSMVGLVQLRNHYGDVCLEIDAEIDGGSHIVIFYNERWAESIAVPIMPAKRLVYTLRGLPADLFALRLDPTTGAHVRVKIFDISLKRGGRTLHSYSPAQIRGWHNTQIDLVGEASDNVYDALSSGDDPIMRVPGPWSLGSDSLLAQFFITPKQRQHFDLGVVAGACLLLLLGSRLRRALLFVYVPLGIIALIRLEGYAAGLLRPLFEGYLGTDQAVGWASYVGFPKQFEFRVVWFAVAMTIVLSWLGARWLRRRGPAEWIEAPVSALPPILRQRWVQIAAGLLLLFVVLVSLSLRLPSFPSLMVWLKGATHALAYDDQNYFTWRYCVYSGWLPMRDFWYPYGGFTQLDGFFPGPGAREFLHRGLLLGIFTSCVYLLCHRSLLLTATMVAAALLAAAERSDIGGEARYGLAINLVLLGLVCRRLRWSTVPSIALGALAAYCLRYEPHQILYASVPLVVLWGSDFLWPRQSLGRDALLRGLRVSTLTFAIGFALRVILLAVEGQLAGQLEFLLQSGPSVVYGALDAEVLSWFYFDPNPPTLLFFGMLFLLGYGTFLRTLRRDGEWDDLGAICLSLGLLTAVVINKQVCRPHMAWQLLPWVELGGMFILFHILLHAQFRMRVVVLSVVVFLLGLSGSLKSFAEMTWRGERLLGQVPGLLRGVSDGEALDRVYSSYFFDEERYGEDRPIIRRLKELIGQRSSDAQNAALYVLGDESFMYAALRLRPPYYITIYNSSPLEAQKRLVRWLEARQPEYVVWRPSRKLFDEIPNLVRVPLLFRAVISQYELRERVGDYHILQRRPSDKPVDLAYFREQLGLTFDVGALAAHSRLARLPVCAQPRGKDCAPVLHVHLESPSPGVRSIIRVRRDEPDLELLGLPDSVAPTEFNLAFLQEKGIRDYYVALERVWFYTVPHPNPPTFEASPEQKLEVINLAGAAQILY